MTPERIVFVFIGITLVVNAWIILAIVRKRRMIRDIDRQIEKVHQETEAIRRGLCGGALPGPTDHKEPTP